MFGITDNPDGKTAFEQLSKTKKKKILLGEDLTESATEQEKTDSAEQTEETSPVKKAEPNTADEPKAPPMAEPISEKALEETKPKEVPVASSVPVDIGETPETKKPEPAKAKTAEKPLPKPVEKPAEKKTNSLPPKPAASPEDDFFSKPMSEEDKEAFKKAFGQKTKAEEETEKTLPEEEKTAFQKTSNHKKERFWEDPFAPAEVKKEEPVPEKPVENPIEKKTNLLPPKPAADTTDSFFDKPFAPKQEAFPKNPYTEVPVEKPVQKPLQNPFDAIAKAPADNQAEKKTNSLPPKPVVNNSDSFFDKPVDPDEMAAFKNSFRKKPAPTEASVPKNPFAAKKNEPKVNPFSGNLSEEEERAAFERAFGKKIKTPEERASARRNTPMSASEIPMGEQTAFQRASAQKSERKAEELAQQEKDGYIPFKLDDMYNPADHVNDKVVAPTTSKDFKLEGIGEMYRPEKEFNRDEFWENAKKGLNSEESREMYWELKRQQRDQKLKKGLKIALSLSIMGLLTGVVMLISREDCFSYLHVGLTVFISFLLLMVTPSVRTLGILGSLFNVGWAGYFGWKFFTETPFSTEIVYLVKLGCYAFVIIVSFIIFIRLCTSKLLGEYYESGGNKKDRESIVKSNPMNR